MILVDTSVWVDHLRRGNTALVAALDANIVVVHAFVVGELACGQLKARDQVLNLLHSLTRLGAATEGEALYFLERHRLFGRGLGYIDVHLLAAAALNHDAWLWTRDKRLRTVAAELGLAHIDPVR
jgi:predicted nucleic acid-binding protein